MKKIKVKLSEATKRVGYTNLQVLRNSASKETEPEKLIKKERPSS